MIMLEIVKDSRKIKISFIFIQIEKLHFKFLLK